MLLLFLITFSFAKDCVNVEFETTTFSWGYECTWKVDGRDAMCSSSRSFSSYSVRTETCCLTPGTHNFNCFDSWGDGWHGGYVTVNGQKLCHDFNYGRKKSTVFTIAAPSGTGGTTPPPKDMCDECDTAWTMGSQVSLDCFNSVAEACRRGELRKCEQCEGGFPVEQSCFDVIGPSIASQCGGSSATTAVGTYYPTMTIDTDPTNENCPGGTHMHTDGHCHCDNNGDISYMWDGSDCWTNDESSMGQTMDTQCPPNSYAYELFCYCNDSGVITVDGLNCVSEDEESMGQLSQEESVSSFSMGDIQWPSHKKHKVEESVSQFSMGDIQWPKAEEDVSQFSMGDVQWPPSHKKHKVEESVSQFSMGDIQWPPHKKNKVEESVSQFSMGDWPPYTIQSRSEDDENNREETDVALEITPEAFISKETAYLAAGVIFLLGSIVFWVRAPCQKRSDEYMPLLTHEADI